MTANLSDIKDRLGTVKTAQKLTKSMKLVSISKYQKYKNIYDTYQEFTQNLSSCGNIEIKDTATQEICGIVFAPDLSLVSTYIKSCIYFLKSEHIKKVIWIGNVGFDTVVHKSFEVLNTKQSSENLDIETIYSMLDTSLYTYKLVNPILKGMNGISFSLVPLNIQLVKYERIEYYPNYDEVNAKFVNMYTLAQLHRVYYESKIVEHKLRQISMDKALDNANELEQQLNNKYNRIRQEKITQEITELMSGKESS